MNGSTDCDGLSDPRISIVMPMRNAASTVARTVESLLSQELPFDELLVVDDASTDDSVEILRESLSASNREYRLIRHQASVGLAESYNDGIRNSTGDLIVTLHSDVVLLSHTALDMLVLPFRKSGTVVAAYHQVDHPLNVWRTYNFWQKCFFSRQAGVRQRGLDGKFDCFLRSALNAVGLFDSKAFRCAGEDGDIVRKLSKKGEVVASDAVILHLHSLDPSFGVRDIVFKHAQYAESQGAIYRRYGILSVRDFMRTFFREGLVIMLLVPWLRVPATVLTIAYLVGYSRRLYAHEWRNPRMLLVPFLNVFLLLVSCYASFRGFARGKQTL